MTLNKSSGQLYKKFKNQVEVGKLQKTRSEAIFEKPIHQRVNSSALNTNHDAEVVPQYDRNFITYDTTSGVKYNQNYQDRLYKNSTLHSEKSSICQEMEIGKFMKTFDHVDLSQSNDQFSISETIKSTYDLIKKSRIQNDKKLITGSLNDRFTKTFREPEFDVGRNSQQTVPSQILSKTQNIYSKRMSSDDVVRKQVPIKPRFQSKIKLENDSSKWNQISMTEVDSLVIPHESPTRKVTLTASEESSEQYNVKNSQPKFTKKINKNETINYAVKAHKICINIVGGQNSEITKPQSYDDKRVICSTPVVMDAPKESKNSKSKSGYSRNNDFSSQDSAKRNFLRKRSKLKYDPNNRLQSEANFETKQMKSSQSEANLQYCKTSDGPKIGSKSYAKLYTIDDCPEINESISKSNKKELLKQSDNEEYTKKGKQSQQLIYSGIKARDVKPKYQRKLQTSGTKTGFNKKVKNAPKVNKINEICKKVTHSSSKKTGPKRKTENITLELSSEEKKTASKLKLSERLKQRRSNDTDETSFYFKTGDKHEVKSRVKPGSRYRDYKKAKLSNSRLNSSRQTIENITDYGLDNSESFMSKTQNLQGQLVTIVTHNNEVVAKKNASQGLSNKNRHSKYNSKISLLSKLQKNS